MLFKFVLAQNGVCPRKLNKEKNIYQMAADGV